MSQLKTLRDVSGLGNEAPSLKGSALIMIDLQNTYREGVMRLEGVEPAILEAAALLKRAREAGIPIFHVQHDAGAGSPYDLSDRIGGRAARRRTIDRQELSLGLRRHGTAGEAERQREQGYHPGWLHDPHVRELDRALGLQPRLPSGGGGVDHGDAQPARP